MSIFFMLLYDKYIVKYNKWKLEFVDSSTAVFLHSSRAVFFHSSRAVFLHSSTAVQTSTAVHSSTAVFLRHTCQLSFVSVKINNSDNFKIKCFSYSEICTIYVFFIFCLHFLFNIGNKLT